MDYLEKKLEHDTICERINKKFPDIHANEHEIQKFLLIFQELILLSYADKEFSDSEESISSLLLTLAKQIQNLLNKDIDSLKFPAVIKKTQGFKGIIKLIHGISNLYTETTSELNNQDNNMARTKLVARNN